MSLLKLWFLRFLFSGTMFFADGASALATVDGGADAGGGASSGDAGNAGSDTSTSDSDGGVDSDRSVDDTSGDDTADRDGADDPNAEVSLADGRKIPAKYKELFEQDKALKESYFTHLALKKTFPGGVKEAVKLARDLDEIGGFDAIEKLQGDNSVYSRDAEYFNNGDPKWTELAFKENPEVSLKHFTNALGYVSEHHPEHYDHLMAKVIVNDLANLPVEKIYSLLNSIKDNPEAQQAAKALAKYYNSRQEYAKKVPEKEVSAQQKTIDAERAKLSEEKVQIRNEKITSQASPYLVRAMETAVAQAAKAEGFDLAKVAKTQPNRYSRFIKDVRNAVHAEVRSDGKWLDAYTQALNSGDTAKCIRMLNKRHDQAIKGTEDKPGVAAQIFAEWFGTGKPRATSRKTDNGGGTERKPTFGKEMPIQVNALPPKNEINYSWSGTDKWEGLYRLKSGKLIQVKRP